MVIVGSTAYYNAGYNEGRYQLYKFSLSNINQVTGYGIGPEGINGDLIVILPPMAPRSTRCGRRHSTSLSYIKAYDLNFNDMGLPPTYVGTGAYGVAGIAVQPAQQGLLFVSNTTDNKVYIFNKSTFTAYSTPYLRRRILGWNTLKSIATTPDGDLWVTCKNGSGVWQILRYTNFGGTPTLAATVSGPSSIRSASRSPRTATTPLWLPIAKTAPPCTSRSKPTPRPALRRGRWASWRLRRQRPCHHQLQVHP